MPCGSSFCDHIPEYVKACRQVYGSAHLSQSSWQQAQGAQSSSRETTVGVGHARDEVQHREREYPNPGRVTDVSELS